MSGQPLRTRRSWCNYPHLLSQRIGSQLVDVTSCGATVKDILWASQFGQPAQISAVDTDTDLVTVIVGGNDMGYVPSLIAACLPAWTSRLPVLGERVRSVTAPARVSDRLPRTSEAVRRVFAAIRQRAPHARVVCVDYLTILPPSYRDDLPFTECKYGALVALARDLNAALTRAAAAEDVGIVRASEHSLAHHAWSDEP